MKTIVIVRDTKTDKRESFLFKTKKDAKLFMKDIKEKFGDQFEFIFTISKLDKNIK